MNIVRHIQILVRMPVAKVAIIARDPKATWSRRTAAKLVLDYLRETCR